MNSPHLPVVLIPGFIGPEPTEPLSLAAIVGRLAAQLFAWRSDSSARATQPTHTGEEFANYASRFETANHSHWSNSIQRPMSAIDICPVWCV